MKKTLESVWHEVIKVIQKNHLSVIVTTAKVQQPNIL